MNINEKFLRQAIEIANSQLKNFSERIQLNQTLLENAYLQILSSLSLAAEFKDADTGKHLFRIKKYSELLAILLGLEEEEVKRIAAAAAMHDIGKVGIPDHILQKNGKLTSPEIEVVKQHSLIGAQIIGDSDEPIISWARDIALSHHEKWNGSGYPYGIAGESIPISARIVGLVDCFDALTSARPYKKAYPVDMALNIIINDSGKSFDPKLVTIFIDNSHKFTEIALEHMAAPSIQDDCFQLSDRDAAKEVDLLP